MGESISLSPVQPSSKHPLHSGLDWALMAFTRLKRFKEWEFRGEMVETNLQWAGSTRQAKSEKRGIIKSNANLH